MPDEITPWWTVVGCWPDLNDINRSQRWMENYQAVTPQGAEDMARFEAQQGWTASGRRGDAVFIVVGVFPGKHSSADTAYAFYADPSIPAPEPQQ